MDTLALSIKRWIISFFVVEALFWSLMATGCVFDYNSCGEGIGFAVVGYYAPFSFFINWLNIDVQAYVFQVISVTLIGLLSRAVLGWFFGCLWVRWSGKWFLTVPMALVCVILVVIIGNFIGAVTGFYS